MLIHIKKSSDTKSSEITEEKIYKRRRDFIKSASIASCALLAPQAWSCIDVNKAAKKGDAGSVTSQVSKIRESIASAKKVDTSTNYYTKETLTPERDVTSYNNFYEFGYDKSDPKRYAHQMTTDPWSIEVTGAVKESKKYYLEDILSKVDLEERVYRLRCVEAWSMVIPWVGFSLSSWISQLGITSKAKYVAFETLLCADEMPGTQSLFSTIDWPYKEGLRIDEAMHDLTFMAVGIYGKELYPQNGAPIRLVVPWKYGFKSIKSIVKIHFQEEQPVTSWNQSAPREYGFYSNVNPSVSHPRWSQSVERRLPGSLFNPRKIETKIFNGYSEVASLYKGMNLKKYF